mmetsp:Transcript_16934/g.22000  ORF Transcript_16934/g.22000 Transcript_16934/m.22000 type:complete len:576 (+) Transcript_16934:132-1859(+)|eukprot:CAMPEP_0117746016 /NCGR_PEP_ID=MMETSP0947-20121206/7707_1 /TAXON_ID=44440 /ORGANISM="Chattonella subsalsa, Strain CCMP2191" /LENGTH=575 /DNA_ID=CAMNT_0005563283 /DNA_START=151 /DNA_END=1878 /DNA_ORIENTATION=+
MDVLDVTGTESLCLDDAQIKIESLISQYWNDLSRVRGQFMSLEKKIRKNAQNGVRDDMIRHQKVVIFLNDLGMTMQRLRQDPLTFSIEEAFSLERHIIAAFIPVMNKISQADESLFDEEQAPQTAEELANASNWNIDGDLSGPPIQQGFDLSFTVEPKTEQTRLDTLHKANDLPDFSDSDDLFSMKDDPGEDFGGGSQQTPSSVAPAPFSTIGGTSTHPPPNPGASMQPQQQELQQQHRQYQFLSHPPSKKEEDLPYSRQQNSDTALAAGASPGSEWEQVTCHPSTEQNPPRKRRSYKRRKPSGHGQDGTAGEGGGNPGALSPKRSGSSEGGEGFSPYFNREVSYECSVCSHMYINHSDLNPWWALSMQECPKCFEKQFPRVDISHPTNSISKQSALYRYNLVTISDKSEESFTQESKGTAKKDHRRNRSQQSSGREIYLEKEQAAKLLILMGHARICTGKHQSKQHQEVCASTKHLMLHLRDCPAKFGDESSCRHPWCQPCKNLLKHLAKCENKSQCEICNPRNLPESLQGLRDQNLQYENNFFEESTSHLVKEENATQQDPSAGSVQHPSFIV